MPLRVCGLLYSQKGAFSIKGPRKVFTGILERRGFGDPWGFGEPRIRLKEATGGEFRENRASIRLL